MNRKETELKHKVKKGQLQKLSLYLTIVSVRIWVMLSVKKITSCLDGSRDQIVIEK